MRLLVVVAVLACSMSARAVTLPRLEVPALSLDVADVAELVVPQASFASVPLDLTPHLAGTTVSTVVPPHYGWALDDGRAFWFAAGASSFVALVTHVLVGLPTLALLVGVTDATNASSPAATVPVLIGVGGAYLAAEGALASLAATLVFNSVSKIYDGNYLVSWAAHIAGGVLGAAVSGLSFGTGFVLLGGLSGLVEFTGSAGIAAVSIFSVLGALPAVVIGGIALVGVPAVISAWSIAVSAQPKEGFVIDPNWRDPAPIAGAARPIVTVPIPGS